MSRDGMQALADSVFLAVQAYIAKSLAGFSARADAVEKRVSTIPAGAKGDPGERGKDGSDSIVAGPRGEKGEPGINGKDGIGERGEKGESGEPGIHGKDGADSVIPGPKGEPGLDGKDGADSIVPGPRGESGLNGKNGADSIVPGPRGDPGLNGKDGADSIVPGPRGEPGLNGKDGSDSIVPGPRGEIGERGEKGADGQDAFAVAKANGFVGSVADWMLSLRGTDGVPGKDGVGRDGTDGFDALDVDVMDGVDVSRSYPRGTFATFNGGTFRAGCATKPLESSTSPKDAGWHCVFRGVSSAIFTIEDGGRFIVQTIKFCDGTEDISRNKTALAIYRGVYRAGHKYDAGDSITFDGSQWTAKAETDEKPKARPPDAEQVWQLSVKRGKDGN